MNLVQIQERLKDAPVQAIMQYANGTNPMVPPYLALAELKRRETMTQSAQAQQAMQQGQQPSVKEQVEQAAGLAGLQRQMQAQGMQNLMAQVRPQGVPENTPQPSRQPESEGVAGLPTGDMYNFRDGGIVAFSGGGTTPAERFLSGVAGSIGETASSLVEQQRAAMSEAEEKKKLRQSIDEAIGMSAGVSGAFVPQSSEAWKRASELSNAAAYRLATPDDLRKILDEANKLRGKPRVAQAESITSPAFAKEDQSYAAKEARGIAAPAQQMAQINYGNEGRNVPTQKQPAAPYSTPEQYADASFALVGDYDQAMQDVMGIRDPQERAAAMAALQRAKPRESQSAAARGIASILGADEASQMIVDAMRKKSTPEGIVEQQRKLEALYGLDKQYGEERAKRIQAMEAERQKSLEDRGLERLMRVMGGMAGRGLAGAGPAYLQSVEAERAADAAFRKQMDEMLGGVEKEQRAEQVTKMKRAQDVMSEEAKSRLESAGKIMDIDSKIKLQELQAKSVLGRLSVEEQYMRDELAKGRRLPEIVKELADAKGGQRAETAEQQRYKDAYFKASALYEDMVRKPKDISREDWIHREALRATRTEAQPTSGIPQQAIADLKQNPQLRAQFDAKYGVGASAKYLGQ